MSPRTPHRPRVAGRLGQLLFLAAIALALAACGGGGPASGGPSNPGTGSANNPVPVINSLSPGSVTVGAAAQALTIEGTGFIPSSLVTLNGQSVAGKDISPTQISAQLTVADQATGGQFAVVVTNPGPGGGASNGVNFTVDNPVPSITGLSPDSASAGAAAQTLIINGSNFVSASAAFINGVSQPATFVNSTELSVELSASEQATAGQEAVLVRNPGPGGGASNSFDFTVNSATLQVASVSPASGATGAPVGSTISVQFNQPMNTASIGAAAFKLSANSQAYPISVRYEPSTYTVVLTPAGILTAGVAYSITVAGSATSSTGATLGAPYSWTFTVESPGSATATVMAPPAYDPTTLSALSFGAFAGTPDASGEFTASIAPQGITLVAAMFPGQNFGLMAIAVNGESQTSAQAAARAVNRRALRFEVASPSAVPRQRTVFAKRLQVTSSEAAAATPTDLGLDFETTAEALVFLSPELDVHDSNRALPILATIAANPDTHLLGEALAGAVNETDPLSDPEVDLAMQAAIQTTVQELAPLSSSSSIPTVTAPMAQSVSSGSPAISWTPNCTLTTGQPGGLPCLNLNFIRLDAAMAGSDYVITPSNCSKAIIGCATDWVGRVAPITENLPSGGAAAIMAGPGENGLGTGSPIGPYAPQCTLANLTNTQDCVGVFFISGNSDLKYLNVQDIFSALVGAIEGTAGVSAPGSTVSIPAQVNQDYILRFYSGGIADSTEMSELREGELGGKDFYNFGLAYNIVDSALELITPALETAVPDSLISCLETHLGGSLEILVQGLSSDAGQPLLNQISDGLESFTVAFGNAADSCALTATAKILITMALKKAGEDVSGLNEVFAILGTAGAIGQVAQRIVEMTTQAAPVETAVAAVTGNAPPLPEAKTVTVSCAGTTVTYGQTVQCTASATDANGNTISTSQTEWTWTSSGAVVANITPTLNQPSITLRAGDVSGPVSVIATLNGVTSPGFEIQVSAPTSAKLTVSPTISVLQAGQMQTFVAQGYAANEFPLSPTVSWTSSNSSVATINATSGVADALTPGTTTITASFGSVTGTATLTVNPPTVARIDVAPVQGALVTGQTYPYSATALDAAGNPIPGLTFSWSTNDSSVATISPSGLLTAIAPGSTQVVASTGAVTGSATVSVQAGLSPSNQPAVTATPVCSGTIPVIDLQWTAVAANNYSLYTGAGTFVVALTTTSDEFEDPGPSGTSVSFYVVATLSTGGTVQSNTATATVPSCTAMVNWVQLPPAQVAPGQSMNLAWSISGTNAAPSSVEVQWDPADPGSPTNPAGNISQGCTLAMDSCDASGASPQTLSAPTADASGAALSTATSVTYVIHAVINGMDLFSPPAKVLIEAGSASMQDNFALDTSLNPTLWTTSSPLLASAASAFASTLEAPQLSFDTQGMLLAGVTGYYEITAVQSVQAFSPPFTVRAQVEGTQAAGNPFVLMLASSDLSQFVTLSGNLNSSNGGYYGMWVDAPSIQPFGGGLGTQLQPPTLAALNLRYSLVISVDASGNATVTGEQPNGTLFGTSAPLAIGNGPYYLLLAQREGLPDLPAGPNAAYWVSVSVTSTSATATVPGRGAALLDARRGQKRR